MKTNYTLIAGGLAGLLVPVLVIGAFVFLDGSDEAVASSSDEASVECAIPEPVPAPSTPELTATHGGALALEPPAPAPAPRPAVELDADGPVRVRRLIIARGVEAHEPTGAADRLARAPGERLYAFVDAVNATEESVELQVTFEPMEGETTGHVGLDVPASSRRYRTWAYTRNAERPGRWEAVVRGPDGRVLARRAFEITE